MKLIILLVIAFAAAIGLASFTHDTSGYVRIHIDPYTIEANLWIVIVGAIALFIVGYLLFRLLGWVFGTRKRVGAWKQKRQQVSAGQSMQRGYIDLIEGKWDSAEKRLTAKADQSPAPVLNYLAAAHAAQQNGNAQARDDYLKKAHENDPSSKVAVDLTQARMQYEAGDLDEAKNTLTRLMFLVPKSEQVHRMLLAVNRERGDHQGVLDQLPKLRKLKQFKTEEAQACENEACLNLLKEVEDKGIEEVDKVWKSLTRAQRKLPQVAEQYAYELLHEGRTEQAEMLVRQALRKSWNTDLAYTYGLINHDAKRQLRLAEGWLGNQPQDGNLLLTLGRLAARSDAKDKAINYYQQAITAGASQEANRELGLLLEDMGESDKALEYYRSGLEQVLPLPKLVTEDEHIVDVGESNSTDETIIDENDIIEGDVEPQPAKA